MSSIHYAQEYMSLSNLISPFNLCFITLDLIVGKGFQIHDQSAIYFMTLTVVGWADIFTRKVHRDIMIDAIKFCQREKGLMVFAFVIMSNHVHLVCKSNSNDLSGAIRDLKRHTSKRITDQIETNPKEKRKEWLKMVMKYHAKYNKRVNDIQLWTHFNHAVELDNNFILDQRMEYVHQNPVKAGIVKNAHEYIYSSASHYHGESCLIQIDEL